MSLREEIAAFLLLMVLWYVNIDITYPESLCVWTNGSMTPVPRPEMFLSLSYRGTMEHSLLPSLEFHIIDVIDMMLLEKQTQKLEEM